MNESKKNIGGVGLEEVITFQTQILMGSQFERINRENCTQKDLLVACLRMGWNDAFRHTSANVKITQENGKVISVIEAESKKKKQDYICALLEEDQIVINAFKDFLVAQNKQEAWNKHKGKLIKFLSKVKKADGKYALCFGHFQKMFNIAAKLYLCLYICREYLHLDEELFDEEILMALSHADCPIDSIILKKFPEHQDIKWSRLKEASGKYEEIQASIAQKSNGNSNLWYDFENWNMKKEE